MTDDGIEQAKARKVTEADRYFLDIAAREPVESIGRIEETARFLVGASTATSGLFLAAVKLALGNDPKITDLVWFWPFIFWAGAITAFILVLLPMSHDTHPNDPGALKQTFLAIRRRKYRYLCVGAALFILGVFAGVLPFLP